MLAVALAAPSAHAPEASAARGPVTTTSRIPRNLYQTTQYRLNCIPNHTAAFADGFTTTIFSDDEARQFIAENYDTQTLQHFDDLPAPHSYDLFRYLLLKKRGGLYLDIKTMPTGRLHDIFALNVTVAKPRLITALSMVPGTIFNGVIAATPEHPILNRLVRRALHTTPEKVAKDYHVFTRQFYEAVVDELRLDAKNGETEPKLKAGHYETESTSVTLLAERCDPEECKPDKLAHMIGPDARWLERDQYGLCCSIRDENAMLKMHTRDPDYPYVDCEKGLVGQAWAIQPWKVSETNLAARDQARPKLRLENPLAARAQAWRDADAPRT